MEVNQKLLSSLPHARTVLLVDDNVYWTDTLAAVLRQAGYAVSAVRDGLEAMERLRTNLPDILVTDYFLPNLDGGKLCQLAKRLAADLHITTIILTGGADSNLSRRPSPHADAVIAKNTTDVVSRDLLRTLSELQREVSPSEGMTEVIGHKRLRPRALSTKLHALKQHLDALHEGIGDAVIGVDAERRIYFLNSMAVDLLGVPEEVALARRVDLVLGIDPTHNVMRRIDEVLEKDVKSIRPLALEWRSFSLRVTVSRLKNPLGEDSVLLIARDISDIVAAEAERASLNAQLHAADKMRSLGQMTAGVSHEINNPLAALLPCLELLSERFQSVRQVLSVQSARSAEHPAGLADARVERALLDIPELLMDAQAAGRQIKAVVAEMRFFAHPGESKGERAQLDAVLNEAIALASREVRYKARLEQDFDYTPTLVIDRGLLSQAVLNVLINASQAIDQATGDDDWIRVKTYRSEGGVAIEISNSGPPIPEDLTLKVFEPFYTTKEPGAGVGLGLSIAYETVRRHGGFIEVVRGTPTTFKIWLPLDTGKGLASVPPLTVPQSEGPLSLRERTPARVLIVDDERLVRNGFRRVLDRRYEVALADGGEQALELIAEHEFDVILCDLLMPQMTGMQLYQRVLATKPEAAERFAFLTGGTACAEARDFLQHVTNPRAFKPLDNDELLNFVERAVRRGRKNRTPAVTEPATATGSS